MLSCSGYSSVTCHVWLVWSVVRRSFVLPPQLSSITISSAGGRPTSSARLLSPIGDSGRMDSTSYVTASNSGGGPAISQHTHTRARARARTHAAGRAKHHQICSHPNCKQWWSLAEPGRLTTADRCMMHRGAKAKIRAHIEAVSGDPAVGGKEQRRKRGSAGQEGESPSPRRRRRSDFQGKHSPVAPRRQCSV